MKLDILENWWKPEYNFFGTFYIEGDDSLHGYRADRRQSLADRTMEEVGGVIRLCQLTHRMSIYDMPCGYGRHSHVLGLLGYTVTGFDINSTHLQKAREMIKDKNSLVTFVEHNMLSPLPVNSADVCINMFYSFGFFTSDEENRLVLVNIYNSLKDGGVFLMHTDVNVPRIETGDYKLTESRILSSGETLHINESYNPETRRIHGSWTVGNIKKEYFVRVYTEEEFKKMCLSIGFSEVMSYGDWDGSPYYPQKSEIMILVAKK